jgi:hypothetical protein
MPEPDASREETGRQPEAQGEPAGSAHWWSDQPAGAKVCALRQETVHLVHTGLSADWDPDQVREYFAEAPWEPAAGGSAGWDSDALPRAVVDWIEALRFAHCELWPEASGQGTTVVLDTTDALWVLTRGAHHVSIAREGGDREAEEAPGLPEGTRLWRLERGARWRVEVALPDGPGTLWSARWRPAPSLVPRPVVETPALESRAPEEVPDLVGALLARWPWRPALPSALRPYRSVLRNLALALVGFAALVILWNAVPKRPLAGAWTWLGDFCAGRYRLHVATVPPGAKLIVDGHETQLRTPGWLLLREGRHRIDASLGPFGTASLAVGGGRGQREWRRASLLGGLALGCADTTVTLYARVDGEPIGRLPAVLDSIPAGRRQLSFQGRDVRPWTEEVGVVAGRVTRVLAHPEKVPDFGMVLARAYKVGTEGLKDLSGALVLLDGKPVGSTPLRLQVRRGLHTVRLASEGVRSPVQLLRVEGGGQLYATAEFGRSPEPEVVEELLGAPSISQPPLVRARLASSVPIRVAEVRLNVRRWGLEFQRLIMPLRAGTVDVQAEVDLPVHNMPPGAVISFFVTVKSDEGEEFVGEMRTVKLIP